MWHWKCVRWHWQIERARQTADTRTHIQSVVLFNFIQWQHTKIVRTNCCKAFKKCASNGFVSTKWFICSWNRNWFIQQSEWVNAWLFYQQFNLYFKWANQSKFKFEDFPVRKNNSQIQNNFLNKFIQFHRWNILLRVKSSVTFWVYFLVFLSMEIFYSKLTIDLDQQCFFFLMDKNESTTC